MLSCRRQLGSQHPVEEPQPLCFNNTYMSVLDRHMQLAPASASRLGCLYQHRCFILKRNTVTQAAGAACRTCAGCRGNSALLELSMTLRILVALVSTPQEAAGVL
ncbi:hypothetical protein ABBQ38_008161 [Trebouxia sp. C0009 RCD-2024]